MMTKNLADHDSKYKPYVPICLACGCHSEEEYNVLRLRDFMVTMENGRGLNTVEYQQYMFRRQNDCGRVGHRWV